MPEQKPGESRVFAEGAEAAKTCRMSGVSTKSQEKCTDRDKGQRRPVFSYSEEPEALAPWLQRGAALRHLMRITRSSTKRRGKEKKKSADDESGSGQDCPHGDLHSNRGVG